MLSNAICLKSRGAPERLSDKVAPASHSHTHTESIPSYKRILATKRNEEQHQVGSRSMKIKYSLLTWIMVHRKPRRT